MLRGIANAARQRPLWMVFSILATFGASWWLTERFEGVYVALYTKTRMLFLTGELGNRRFSKDGIAQVGSSRNGGFITSPFYVVHYGLIYSLANKSDSFDWLDDPTVGLWPDPPPVELVSKNNVVAACDWVVAHAVPCHFGPVHLMYDFEWRYPNADPSLIQPPWWSGLTDALAVELLCRGFDLTGNTEYLASAKKLYDSLLAPVSEGGSLVRLGDGRLMIEEYVDPRAKAHTLVLNGAIYAAMAIDHYERRFGVSGGIGDKLLRSIELSIDSYKAPMNWSYYDNVKTCANLKYHRINAALVEWLAVKQFSGELHAVSRTWSSASANPLQRVFVMGNWSPLYFFMAIFTFGQWVCLFVVSMLLYNVIRSRYQYVR